MKQIVSANFNGIEFNGKPQASEFGKTQTDEACRHQNSPQRFGATCSRHAEIQTDLIIIGDQAVADFVLIDNRLSTIPHLESHSSPRSTLIGLVIPIEPGGSRSSPGRSGTFVAPMRWFAAELESRTAASEATS